MSDRDGRSMQRSPKFENRAPDPVHASFMIGLRNNRAKKHNQVRFEAMDALLPNNKTTKSVVTFGLN